MRRLWVLAIVCLAPRLGAQVVRGRVTDRESGSAQGGVVVELRTDQGDARVAASLSAPDGQYALRAPGAGRYAVVTKRIGVRRTRTEPFDLGAGEAIVRDIQVDVMVAALPEIRVLGLATCDPAAEEGARVNALWDEARTALDATQLSLRDKLYRASVTRYVRELDLRTHRVLTETKSQVSGVVSRPFAAIDGDSLSRAGYVQPRVGGGSTFFGPDAEILLSDAFLRDHCFHEARPTRAQKGLVGLGFRPAAGRTVPDVVGALWLDERTFELRYVSFAYSRVPTGADSAFTGGEVHFTRLAGGAWMVSRWFLRLPVVARPSAPVGTEVTQAPWVLVRPAFALREEGGTVVAEPASVRPPR